MSVAKKIVEAQEKGSFIRKMFEEGIALKKEFGSENVFDFSLGNPDIEPPVELKSHLLRIANEEASGMHGYMPNAGFLQVRQALAQKVNQEQGVNCGPEHLVMSVGAAGGLNALFKAILNPGDEVLVPSPYFVEYGSYIDNHGGIMRLVPSGKDFSLDVPAIVAALNEKTAAVLINSPHNPTGRIYSAESLAELSQALTSHARATGREVLLVGDEPYRDLVYDGAVVPPFLAAHPNSVVVTSYSKSLSLPGERIGYVAINPAAEAALELAGAVAYTTRVLGFVNAPALMQRLVADLVGARVAVEIYAQRRRAFTQVLDAAGLEYSPPEGAFYLFCKVPARKKDGSVSDLEFVNFLKKERILAVPGTGFGATGYIRLAYCVDEKLIRASQAGFIRAVNNWLG